MPVHEFTILRPDGTKIGVLVLGVPSFTNVIIHHHGFPASRLEALLARRICKKLGITVIAIDRPGIGLSDFIPNRSLVDIATDVEVVLDHFKVEKCRVLGVSGGTPSAIATAARLKNRVHSLMIVSGVGPMYLPGALTGTNLVNKTVMRISQRLPSSALLVVKTIATVWRYCPWVVPLWFGALLPKSDKEILTEEKARDDLSSSGRVLGISTSQALLQGTKGVVADYRLLASRWDGLLDEVEIPTSIWHGTGDTYVPFSMGRILHERIKGSTFRAIEGGGHFMIVNLLPEVLATLAKT